MVTVFFGETITFSGQCYYPRLKNVTVRLTVFVHDSALWLSSFMKTLYICVLFRINLPKRRLRGEEEEGEGGSMKNSNSSEQLDGEGDTASEVSSEVSFSYEFAQTEVMMKALGSNGEFYPLSFIKNKCV